MNKRKVSTIQFTWSIFPFKIPRTHACLSITSTLIGCAELYTREFEDGLLQKQNSKNPMVHFHCCWVSWLGAKDWEHLPAATGYTTEGNAMVMLEPEPGETELSQGTKDSFTAKGPSANLSSTIQARQLIHKHFPEQNKPTVFTLRVKDRME